MVPGCSLRSRSAPIRPSAGRTKPSFSTQEANSHSSHAPEGAKDFTSNILLSKELAFLKHFALEKGLRKGVLVIYRLESVGIAFFRQKLVIGAGLTYLTLCKEHYSQGNSTSNVILHLSLLLHSNDGSELTWCSITVAINSFKIKQIQKQN